MKPKTLLLCTMFLTFASTLLAQRGNAPAPPPVEPFKIVGNVYFVGPESDHSSFLITTPQGHILINSGYERQLPIIRASIEKLGFKLNDVKIVLGSHAHNDHQEGDAQMKQVTGAQVMAMEQDVPALQKMRPGDKPHPIDRVLHDKDTVQLGGTTLTALLTPGHTKGCTTFTMKAQDAGKTYDVVFGCGFGAGGRPMVNNKEYPEVIDDYARTYKIARTLHADVFLGSHGHHYGLMEKVAKLGKGPNPFINEKTLPEHVDAYEKEYQGELAKQRAQLK